MPAHPLPHDHARLAGALTHRSRELGDDVDTAIELGVQLGAELFGGGQPGAGQLGGDHRPNAFTLQSTLAAVAEGSAQVARVIEPHLDALSILAECPRPVDLAAVHADDRSSWGVFAAESPGTRLEAQEQGGRWMLSGRKPWCSLADRLSHALVTAHTLAGRRLFAVDLREQVTAHPEAWAARGLPGVTSGPADFADAPAVPVGEAGWYLDRPGFEWGGIRVAACWAGAARSLAERVQDAAEANDSEVLWLHAGRVAVAVHSAELALRAAAAEISTGEPHSAPEHAARLAQLTRSLVRAACDTVLRAAADALGPAPAALDPWFAAQSSDLALYLLQDHGDRDLARLGRLSAATRGEGEGA